jgi:hypothetical protein
METATDKQESQIEIALEYARKNQELEGLSVSPEIVHLGRQLLSRQITREQYVERARSAL